MSEGKQRHGCLTAWLVLMIVANAATALMYLLGSTAIKQNFPSAPGWAFPMLAVMGIVNVVCAVGLFQWKKWGFLGFLATSIITFVINVMVGLNLVQAIFGLAGFAILYGVLHIGKERKGWTQLD